jgi:uncharacterized protein YceH (UPF0502 family)
MELSVAEGRVLGCLVEKQLTEPDDTYSLTLDELRFSCNQTSGRDPVVAFDDRTVEDTLLSLKAMGLARYVTVGHRARPLTYRHRADERWRLGRSELAVLAILLLRGPQTVDQIWSLLKEMDGPPLAGNPTDVEVALDTLAGRTPTPLAARLARSGGAEGSDGFRWVEVLTGRYTLDQGPGERYDPGRPAPSRRGSGLPAREPWRPDERFDSRGRRERPERQERQGRRNPPDRRDIPNREAPNRDMPNRDGPGRYEPSGPRGPRDPRDQRDQRDQRGPGEPVPVRAGPPVPLAVPADQAARPAPTLSEVADRLTQIERRLAGIEAALAALRPGPPGPSGPPGQPGPPPQQRQGQQPPATRNHR